ncbi:hypothetical protein OS493_023965 [Desmophyllum pertusum]|uniref:Uncharacterized protein n=1 Tax=Desmophyllum pertusum TaxID=174260 RepID=A0A9W9ZZ75_9CNID|nr:hypothetical protein OS493_023965 [Desmophyllum pertusum]
MQSFGTGKRRKIVPRSLHRRPWTSSSIMFKCDKSDVQRSLLSRAMAGRKKGRSADAEIPPAPKQNTARRALVQEQLAEKENFPMLEIVLPGVQEIAETKKTLSDM